MNPHRLRPAFALAVGLPLVSACPLAAQTIVPIPLEYNFNGIVHAGEDGVADDPAGFRSISDRALDFTGGVPTDSLLDLYTLVDLPGVLDLVHLGNRDKVAGGAHAFDATADGDNVGIQPTWLAAVDQTGPQTSTLNPPLPIPADKSSTFSFLFHISNGGGGFEVVFDFAAGLDLTLPVSGPDWFGGDFPGTGSVDRGSPDGNLNLQEFEVSLTAYAGNTLQAVTFQNPDSSTAGYAIFAATLLSADVATNTLRTAGSNPNSYATTSLPVLGSTYSATVDLMGTTGHDFALLVGFAGQANVPLPNGLVLLVDPDDPAGELLGLSATPGPVASFSLPIPSDLSFAGFTLSTQAVHAGGTVGGYSLSNAYDHVLGL